MTESAPAREGPRAPQENSFTAQFNNPERIEVPGGRTSVVDIEPSSRISDASVLLAPAWACTLPVYEPALEHFYRSGLHTIAFEHPRFGFGFRGARAKDAAGPYKTTDSYPTEGLRRALNVLSVIGQKASDEKVIGVGQSLGGEDLIIAAALEPKKFKYLFLTESAWLIGQDNASRLVKGITSATRAESFSDKWVSPGPDSEETLSRPEIGVTEEEKIASGRFNRGLKSYVGKNPIRTVREIFSV
jgi:pimeloyl-ACP methyl ester carboxylesterase